VPSNVTGCPTIGAVGEKVKRAVGGVAAIAAGATPKVDMHAAANASKHRNGCLAI
jgi:hypothetical protein